MEVSGLNISNYGVVVSSGTGNGVKAIVEKPIAAEAPSNLASIGRYVLTSDIFTTLRCLTAGLGVKFSLQMRLIFMRSRVMWKSLPQWTAF